MNRPIRCGVNIRVTFVVLLVSLCGNVAIADVQHALWQSQEVRFDYRGRLTQYDCSVLGAKVQQLLGVLGASDQTSIHWIGCRTVGADLMQLASMQISLVSAVPSDSRARMEIDKHASRRELLRRLGTRQMSAAEFPAQWQLVDLGQQTSLKLSASDCELLQQLRKQVLPKLATKVVQSEVSCSDSPHRLRQPRLKVLALTPLIRLSTTGSLLPHN